MRDGSMTCPLDQSVEVAAVALMRDAFAAQPKYHYPAHVQVPLHCLDWDLLSIEELTAATVSGTAVEYLKSHCSSWKQLAFSFLVHSGPQEIHNLQLLAGVDVAFRRLSRDECSVDAGKVLVAVSRQLQAASPSDVMTVFRSTRICHDVLMARCIVLLLEGAVLCSNEDRPVLLNCVLSVAALPGVAAQLMIMMPTMPAVVMAALVADFQMYLTVEAMSTGDGANMNLICRSLKVLFEGNFASPNGRDGIIHYSKFYNGLTDDFEDEDIREDVARLMSNDFAFASFPFLVNARYKSLVLQLEASVDRNGAIHDAVITNLFANRRNVVVDDVYLVLNVHRNDLVNSAVRELRMKQQMLRRPLRIHFVGEEGVDEGGLKKEFFQMLVRELLHPNYNMFMNPESSPALWFVPRIQNSMTDVQYRLIGQCIGLAVFNNITLDLAFPSAIFRKLLNVPVTYDDLADVDPQLKQGLDSLLAFEEGEATVEEMFCRTFVYEHRIFDEAVSVPIVPGGQDIPLTGSNRQQFVQAITEYVLNLSIEENFNTFREGFFSVCTRAMVTSLRPEELECIVCGNRSFDMDALRSSTVYEGFDDDDDAVRFMWEVLDELDDASRRKFLKFCTGSDRIPVGGVADLHFIVGKNGDDSELLPTSHTCFNHLLLPAYATKEKLREKLMLAVENCEGFFGGK
ncbi:Hypothetical protein, putative [Bodo saltans]|uniref:HECT-type E3 ubiquitin transferase n=1 Tax=Bodo saltans TaxID=75058 RepID=A0A0S4KI77_BODSA|nr:Hypothetical protein, putative [Bodo saltans]|eukprot:CUI15333.1 Hypothetical protein, putative [Bodo saltans]